MLGCILNSIAAFAFAMFDFKGKKILFVLILLSFMIPFEAIALPLYQVADRLNMVNTYQGMIIPGIASGLVMFLFIQFFRDAPAELLEAARVDGAKISIIFLKILMPLSKPIFITAGLMLFMDQWNSYLWPLLIARSKDIRTIQIALSAFTTEHSTASSRTLCRFYVCSPGSPVPVPASAEIFCTGYHQQRNQGIRAFGKI